MIKWSSANRVEYEQAELWKRHVRSSPLGSHMSIYIGTIDICTMVPCLPVEPAAAFRCSMVYASCGFVPAWCFKSSAQSSACLLSSPNAASPLLSCCSRSEPQNPSVPAVRECGFIVDPAQQAPLCRWHIEKVLNAGGGGSGRRRFVMERKAWDYAKMSGLWYL